VQDGISPEQPVLKVTEQEAYFMIKGKQVNKGFEKRFSLNQILNEDPAWVSAIEERLWHRVKSSVVWKQSLNLNERLAAVELQLKNNSMKLDKLLANNGGGH